MELANNNILYDCDIVSNNFIEYKKLYYNISLLDSKKKYEIVTNLHDYNLINNNESYHIKKTIIKTKNKIFQIKELFNFENKSILEYKNYYDYFFQYHEIIKKFKLIKLNSKILEISNMPSVFESCYYYEKQKYNKQSSYVLDYFSIFAPIYYKKNDEDNLKLYSQNFKININHINTYFDKKLFIDIKTKYNLIFAKIICIPELDINISKIYELSDYINYELHIVQLYYALLRLELTGHLVFPVLEIKTKKMADLVILISNYFEEYHLYIPECQHKYKWASCWVIYKNLKIDKFNELKIIVDLIMKNKPEDILRLTFSSNIVNAVYNINSNTIIDKKYIDDNKKYIVSLLQYNLTNPIYDKIKKFNKYIYFIKMLHLELMNNYTNSSEEKKEKILKKQRRNQIINGLLYAKKWGFNTIPIDFKKSDLNTLILSDMYSLYKPIVFEYSIYTDDNNIINIPKDFINYKINIDMADYILNTRNIDELEQLSNMLQFYKPIDENKQLKTIIQKEFNQKYVAQSWIKMYEIIKYFNIIPDTYNTYNTFHLCEAPGNFISAINHYIKTKTYIKNFDWCAHSLNLNSYSDELKDNYNYISKYPEKWIFGYDNTGNIMDTKNIKYYKKYTLDRNIKLLTSNCSIPDDFDDEQITKLHIAQLIFILYNLPNGSTCVAKLKFPIVHSLQIELYYKYYQSFDKLFFYKSHTNPTSKEFYLIGIGYNRNVLEKELKSLLTMLDNYDENLDKERKFPESFLLQLLKIYKVLVDNYLFHFKRKLLYIDNYKNMDTTHFQLIDDIIYKKNNEWIESHKLIKINDKDLL